MPHSCVSSGPALGAALLLTGAVQNGFGDKRVAYYMFLSISLSDYVPFDFQYAALALVKKKKFLLRASLNFT